MTPLPFLRPIALAALLGLAACGEGASAGAASEAPAVQPAPNAASRPAAPFSRPAPRPVAAPDPAGLEAGTATWLRGHMEDADNADLWDAAVGARIAREGACANADCRRAAAADRLAAARFAGGETAHVPGLPFTHGHFRRAEAGYTGPVRLVPMGAGEALLVISLSFRGRPVCTLDATVQPARDGAFTVAPLDAELPGLVLTPEGRNAFTLSYADPSHQPYQVDHCTVGASIDGRYALAG